MKKGYKPKQITSFVWEGKRYDFSPPYMINVTEEDDMYTFHDNLLGTYSVEISEKDLLESFYDLFASLWVMYAERADTHLSEGAKELKVKLSALCKVTNVT